MFILTQDRFQANLTLNPILKPKGGLSLTLSIIIQMLLPFVTSPQIGNLGNLIINWEGHQIGTDKQQISKSKCHSLHKIRSSFTLHPEKPSNLKFCNSPAKPWSDFTALRHEYSSRCNPKIACIHTPGQMLKQPCTQTGTRKTQSLHSFLKVLWKARKIRS